MTLVDQIRRLSARQQQALRAIDREEQNAVALENLEEEHVAAEEAYLRRKDRLLGREVAEIYVEVETARAALATAIRQRQARFEARRIAVLHMEEHPAASASQLDLI
ncbi:MAG TPA: hypothetical protein VFE30_06715 [Anaeromyxobacteraceae bacterium]|jgi:hypothetical protein|nr:hypothetical protein [Anaeromyxobacteraceae bacterium]